MRELIELLSFHTGTIEFSLNVLTEFRKFGDKKYYIKKRLFEPATSWVRD